MSNPKQPFTPAQAMNRAAALCARSEQATSDIRDKLFKWGLSGNEVNEILHQLTDQGFLDEARYARAFVKDRFALNGWGRIKIAHRTVRGFLSAPERYGNVGRSESLCQQPSGGDKGGQ